MVLIQGIHHFPSRSDGSEVVPTTIPAAVMASVARRGPVEAVIDGGVRLTYADLGDRFIETTRAMMAAGIDTW